ncbi:class I SAM-dependent methyltransferase [Casimicrobium huifangae]|uniref:class I SAM-dependent methyltransferase n=1 Tax=Casimicrobium huifangae TaxID=2591109 RepID=UPI00139691DB|nr:class I SAM-dependent methyltransferase [Casimicrobium huifangae]
MKKFTDLIEIWKSIVFQTNRGRWAKVAVSGMPSWDSRNRIIGTYILPGSSVIDLGCGAQTLKKHIATDCIYQPCDLIKSTPDVIVCDFNKGDYPNVGKKFDYVVCSGVLEYIRDSKMFLKKIWSLGDTVILSYNPRILGVSVISRMTNNWINHYSRSELEALFVELGVNWYLKNKSQNEELIYLLKK